MLSSNSPSPFTPLPAPKSRFLSGWAAGGWPFPLGGGPKALGQGDGGQDVGRGRWAGCLWAAHSLARMFRGPGPPAEALIHQLAKQTHGSHGGAPRPSIAIRAGPVGGLIPRALGCLFPGLSPPLKDVLRIAVVAVVFAAVSGWGLVIPVCQSEKLRISESAARGSRTPSPRTQRGRARSDAARGASNWLIPLPAARTSHFLLVWQVF